MYLLLSIWSAIEGEARSMFLARERHQFITSVGSPNLHRLNVQLSGWVWGMPATARSSYERCLSVCAQLSKTEGDRRCL